MKKLLLLILPFLFFTTKAQITFQKTYGTADNEQLGSMVKTTDGGFIMAGTNTNQNTAYVVKTDSNGVLQWTKKYESLYHLTAGTGISTTADDGYILTGTISDTNNHQRALLVKIKADGTFQWAKNYGDTAESGKQVKQTTDKGYIVIGNSGTYTSGIHVYVFKTDSTGALQWTQRISGNSDNSVNDGSDNGCSIMQTADGNFVLLATTFSHYAGSTQICVNKINAVNGSQIWRSGYGPLIGFPYVSDFVQTPDKGFMILGTAIGGGNAKTFLIKTDTVGNRLWGKAYSDVYGTSLIQTLDSGFAFTGTYYSSTNILVYKTKADGTLQWAQSMGNVSSGYQSTPQTILQNSNQQYIVGGHTSGFGAGQKDFYLLKTDELGSSHCNTLLISPTTVTVSFAADLYATQDTLGTASVVILQTDTGGVENTICYNIAGINQFTNNTQIKIYPNPANNKIIIDATDVVGVKLIDVLGNQILSTNQKNIDVSNISNGVYFLNIKTNQGLATKKIIIQH